VVDLSGGGSRLLRGSRSLSENELSRLSAEFE